MVSHRDSDWLAGAPTAAGRCAAAEGGATCSGEAQGEGVYDATSPMRHPASRYRPASRSESRGGDAVRQMNARGQPAGANRRASRGPSAVAR